MKKLMLVAALAVGASCVAFATTTDELEVCINNNAATCITVHDNGAGDFDGGVDNQIDYTNKNFHGWKLTIITGASNSPDNVDPGLDVTSLTATCTLAGGCGANSLDIIYSDVNFVVPAVQWQNAYSTTITGGSGTTSQLAWVDTSNTIFGMPGGGAVGAVGPFNATNSGITLGGPVTTTSPYSLTLEQIFTDSGTKSATGVTFSSDGALSGVPEPGALILFGTVVVMCASKLRRRIAS